MALKRYGAHPYNLENLSSAGFQTTLPMVLLRLLLAAIPVGTVLADLNYTALLQLPACSVKCSASIVETSGCQLTNLTSCLCTNSKLQYELGLCVLASCNTTEQALASSISQKYICNGPVESKSKEVIRNSIIIAAVTFPIVFLRFVSRLVLDNKLWWDDWTILIAGILMVPNSFSPIYSSYFGFGKHFYDIPAANFPLLLKLFYASSIIYVILQNLPKISICFLYLRVFPTPSFVRIVKLVLTFIILQATIFTILVVFQCTPIDSIWDLSKKGKCYNRGNLMTLVGAGFSIGQDVFIMFLPLIELRKLRMSLKKKVALAFMFAVGSFGCITAMVRLKFIIKYFYTSYDFSWDTVDVVLWSDIETYSAVICACLICIHPLFIRFLPSIFRSSKGCSNSRSSAPKESKNRFPIMNTYHRFRNGDGSDTGKKSIFKSLQSHKTGTMSTFHHGEEEGVKSGFQLPFERPQSVINNAAPGFDETETQELGNGKIKVTFESRVSFHEPGWRGSKAGLELSVLNVQREKSLDLGDATERNETLCMSSSSLVTSWFEGDSQEELGTGLRSERL